MLAVQEQNDAVVTARQAEQHGNWDDALLHYTRGLEQARHNNDGARAMDILLSLGRVYFERGEYDHANQQFLECLVMARGEGRVKESAAALNAMAVVAQFRGELDVAEPLYMQAEQMARAAGDDRLCGMIAQNLGTLANIRGDMPTAVLRYQVALEKFNALEDDRAAAWVLNNMGMLHVDVNEFTEADLCFKSAHIKAKKQGDLATVGKVATNHAELYIKLQQFEQAREHCDHAFETFSSLASHTGLGEAHKVYGILHRETGRLQVAHVQLSLALELARRCDNPLLEAETESELARVYLVEKQYRRAIVSLNRSYTIFCELDARREILDLRRRLDRLEEPLAEAIQLFATHGNELMWTRPAARGRRVAEYAVALGKAAGVTDLSNVRIASYLLDVGTATVPSEIIDRNGPLTYDERQIVQTHCARGEELLRDLGFSNEIVGIVRRHHERWDGNGYPDGLAGADIPLAARIVAIADAYDALTSRRAFRDALDPATALMTIKTEAGKAYDPSLCNLFFNLDVIRSIAFDTPALAATPEVV